MKWEPLSLLLWLGLCISGLESQEYDAVETRKAGQTLSVQCPYNQQQFREQPKGWHKLRGRTYHLLVSTQYTSRGGYQKKVTVKRTTIQDDTDKGVVNITMKMLRMQDTGEYWCALFFRNAWYPLKIIQLRVSKRVQEHKALEGQNLIVRCPYSARDYSRGGKVWCRYTGRKTCDVLVSTYFSYGGYGNQGWVKRTAINDDTQNGTVTIIVKKLQADDSGIYWCAFYDPPRFYQLVEVRLAVFKSLTTENVLTTLYTAPAFNFSTLDARYNGEPQSNGQVSFGGSSWLVLLLGALTSKTLMAVTIALLARRRRRRGEAPEQVRSLDFMVPQSSRA